MILFVSPGDGRGHLMASLRGRVRRRGYARYSGTNRYGYAHAHDRTGSLMLEQFNSLVGGLPSPVIYGLVAGLVFAEAALFFGFVFPGETAIIVGGVLASQGKLSLSLLLTISIAAAIIGDSVGYEIGRRYGIRLLDTKAMRKHQSKVAKAQELIRRRGAFAVFIGRFTALLRALMPALVGSARLPYGRFLVFN